MIILPSRNGMLLRNSNGIISSDCGGFSCPCELLTGTKCSCYGTSLTPSTYIADFGEMGKFCLNYVSGCTWQKSVGTITVTLNLTYATNTTRLTVVDGSITVFSGDLVATSCDGRKYGTITNTVSPSDWGDVVFTPACSDNSCLNGRLINFKYSVGNFNVGHQFYSTYCYVKFNTSIIGEIDVYGFMGSVGGTICRMSIIEDVISRAVYTYSPSCSLISSSGGRLWKIDYAPSIGHWSVQINVLGQLPNQMTIFGSNFYRDISTIAIGETISLTPGNSVDAGGSICGSGLNYFKPRTGVASTYIPATASLTIY